MKYLVKYGSFVRHTVSCNSNVEVKFCREQLALRKIPCEVIDLTLLGPKERALYSKAEFGFIRFKKEILKKI